MGSGEEGGGNKEDVESIIDRGERRGKNEEVWWGWGGGGFRDVWGNKNEERAVGWRGKRVNV